jgi:multidrug efflux system membrane fusion protein
MATIIPPEAPSPVSLPKPEREPIHALPTALPADRPKSGLRYVIYAVLALVMVFVYPYVRQGYDSYVAGRKDEGKKGPPPAIPVGTATARRGDLDIYLTGLGTVTPLRTVTIRSRVDGELIKVHFKEGDLVEEGKLLAQIDPRPYKNILEQATAQKLRDEATLANARAIQARNMLLIKSNAIAQQDVETQATVIKELEALVQTDQAKVDDADLNVKYCDIKAPLPGRIGLRTVDQGNMIRANEPTGLAVITQLAPITIIFAIPQDSITKIQKQINAGKTLEVDAYDRGLKTKLDSGTLLALDNQVDPTTGTIRLKARFDNKEQLLYPNQFVNVRLLLDTRREMILVPSAAVQTGPASDYVYVVNADETVALRQVKQGPAESDSTAIESGLTAGEIVVVDGIDKLKPGSKVTTRKPGEGKGKSAAAKDAS